MAARLFVAQQLYEANCRAVGGNDRDGFPLPTWAEMIADKRKHPVVDMWVAAADRCSVNPRQSAKATSAGGWE